MVLAGHDNFQGVFSGPDLALEIIKVLFQCSCRGIPVVSVEILHAFLHLGECNPNLVLGQNEELVN